MTRVRNATRVFAFAAFVALTAVACRENTGPKVAKKLALPDSARQVLWGTRTVLTTNGVNKGELLSDTTYLYDDGGATRLELRRINVTFFTADGKEDGTLTAQEGTRNERLQRLEARGNVIVVRKDGSRLETPQLVYDQARNLILSDSTFKIVQPGNKVGTGRKFESDPHLSVFRCFLECKGVAPVKMSRE